MGEAMNEAVERIERWLRFGGPRNAITGTDEVEAFVADLRALLAERDALRKALEPFAERAVGLEDFDDEDTVQFDPRINVGDFRFARQALTGAPDHE